MVERIVTAGREVLVSDGYDAFSTNRVADVADISPGSLYQYFPNKTAIIDVVIDRYMASMSEQVVAALGDRIAGPPEDLVRGVLDALVCALESDAALLHVAYEVLPLARNNPARAAVEQRVQQLATAYLAVRGLVPAPATAAWVMVLAIENLAVRWVIDRPPISREAFLDELVALVTGYLPLG
ncbi:TetR family transcriptional regulator [Nocardioides baekrokdamisoli]|uniref:TetR family transcriptional regulator n=2 Tax=Nocardioides baekrokdamisoli TaxID=1804624 RepID=A0A3G9J4M6_9ACTN|nr:TetR family transcriptional regulator [Nocardioides baekrokdamisoli]